MQRLEISGAVRPIYGSLGVKRLRSSLILFHYLPPRSSRCTLPVRFPHETLHTFLLLPPAYHMPRPTQCPWFHHMNISWWIPTTKLFIRSFLHQFPVTYCLLAITIFLSALFSYNLSLYSSANVRDQVSHPLKKELEINERINETINFSKCQHLQLATAARQRCALLLYWHCTPTVRSKPDRKLRLSSNPGWRTLSNGPFSVLMEIPCHACMECDRAASQEPLCHPDVVLLYRSVDTAPSPG